MPSKPNPSNKVKLDPIFPVPVGAEDIFVYNRDNADPMDPGSDSITVDDLSIIDDLAFDNSVTDADASALGVPDSFSIVSETIRRASGGVVVVDVVVGIDDVPGATDYDVQIVKT